MQISMSAPVILITVIQMLYVLTLMGALFVHVYPVMPVVA